MPLTNAEKQRRYREKLKNNPQKKEEIRKKNLERIKKQTKKIQDLTEDEKTKKRKQWREQKRKQKINKNATEKNETKRESEPINNNPKFNIRLKKLKINYKKALNTIVKLNKTIASLRKRNYRQKILHEVKIQKKEKEIDKLTCRVEVTESMVKAMYKCSSSLKKRELKDVALNETRRHNIHSKGFVAKCFGVARVRKYKKVAQRKSEIIREEITKYYVRDEITRLTAGKKECRTKHKEKHQIRYLTDTISNLYKIYKSGGGQHSFTTFYKYKPYFVISPTAGSRDTCLCIKHSNMNYLLKAMIYNKLIDRYTTLKDILLRINCDITSFDCMHSKCPECENSTMEFNVDDDKEKEQVKWWWWQSEKHSYTKRDKNSGQDKDMLTRKMTKQLKTGTLTELIETFNKELKLFKKHYFNMKTQQNQYRACMEQLKSHEVLIICDYSENYNTKLSEEIQSMHFGASKQQVTLHCVMVYWKDKCQSFCTVSDSPCHEPAAIWAHLLPVIKFITEHSPNTTVLHFYSDGPTSQYRQKKNYFLLNMFVQKMNFDYATWSFTESGHGKGVADGIGGAVKRCLDRQVLYGHDLRNADDVFTNITAAMKSVKSFWIPVQDIENMKKIIPTNLRPLTGNNEMHQIVTTKKENVVLHRPLSCFCGSTPGLCSCYFPKSHSLLENRRFADAVVQEEHNNSEMFLSEHISLLDVSPHSEDAVVQEENNCKMFLGEHISLLDVSPHSEVENGEIISQAKLVFEELPALNIKLTHPGSINLIMVPLGCALSGVVTSPIGRRRSMQMVNIPFFIAWLLFHFSTTTGHLYGALFLTGLAGGLLEAPVLTYVAEVTQPHLRGALTATSSLCIIIGVFMQFLFGIFMYWRTVALVNILFTALAVIALCFVPESPHWLVAKKRYDDARKSLQWLRGWTTPNAVEHELQDIRDLFKREQKDLTDADETLSEKLSNYMRKSFMLPFFLVTFSFFVGNFSGMTTLQTYAVSIFQMLKAPIDKYYATLILGVLQIVGASLCVVLVHYTGKRPLTLFSTGGAGVCCILVASYDIYIRKYGYADMVEVTNATLTASNASLTDLHEEVNNPYSWMPMTLLMLLALVAHTGLRLLPWILVGEVFSAKTRSGGAGVSSAVGYLFGFLSNKMYINMVDTLSIWGTYGLYGIVCCIGVIVFYFILPETEGKKLNDIENHYAGKTKLTNQVYKSQGKQQRVDMSRMHELKGTSNPTFEGDTSKL